MKFTLPDELIFMQNSYAKQKKSEASLHNKWCVITGATSGVGLEALKQCAKGGANLVMVGRNLAKAEKIKNEIQSIYHVTIDIVIADFSDLDEVRSAASHILKTYPKIEVLINSAGIHSTTAEYNKDDLEMVFCVNHLASFLFTKLLIPRMKDSAPARIIQINSEGHRFNGLNLNDLNWKKRMYTGLRGYGASKTAQLLTVWELADELKDTGVSIIAMHPGEVRTNIGQNNGALYRWFSRHVTYHFLKDPAVSGESIYYLAADPEMCEVSGKFFNLTVEEKPAKHALNRNVGKQIYEMSMQLTGLSGGVTDEV